VQRHRAANPQSGQNSQLMTNQGLKIAALAAGWVVEEGLEYGAAKQRAAKQLGVKGHSRLPSDAELDDAVKDYIAVFCPDSQAQELAALRQLALLWMNRFAVFRPHLGGAVWYGTATRHSDIYLQLFCDDSKSAEMALIEQRVSYLPRTVTGFTGSPIEALSIHVFCAALREDIGVHLMIYDYNDLRGALKPDAQGRQRRGDSDAVRHLLGETST
jgi:hypothetical protein